MTTMWGPPAPALPAPPALAARLAGSPLLVLLDIDGTLSPIAPTPEAAFVPDGTKRAVAALAERPGVHVALISGRAAPDARRMVGVPGVWAIGNHGMERIAPDGELRVHPEVAPFQARIAQASATLSTFTREVPGVLVENKLWTLSVHYRLADRKLVPRLEKLLSDVAGELTLRLTSGKEVFELRPPVHIHKGTATIELAREVGALAGPGGGAVLYAGDDRTDEDAIRQLRAEVPAAVTIHVGDRAIQGTPTAAEFTVPDPVAMCTFLEWLVEARDAAVDDAAVGDAAAR